MERNLLDHFVRLFVLQLQFKKSLKHKLT